jgi:hypothetical protein
MTRIRLFFISESNTFSLLETAFNHPLLGAERCTLRGAEPLPSVGTFRWSQGVVAMSILLVKHSIQRIDLECHAASNELPTLEGGPHSLAASFDYALSKMPLWLQDMFGFTAKGQSIAHLVFRRINPNRKRSGPVVVFISNTTIKVEVIINGHATTSRSELVGLLEALMTTHCPQESRSILLAYKELSKQKTQVTATENL